MIGTMEEMEDESPLEENIGSSPKEIAKKCAAVKTTPSITNFFKPSIKPIVQEMEVKAPDLRSYFQVSKKAKDRDVPQLAPLKGKEKTTVTEDKGGEEKQKCKKRKKGKGGGENSSGDDFESPPPSRRKRKLRLDSDSIDYSEEVDGKPVSDGSSHQEVGGIGEARDMGTGEQEAPVLRSREVEGEEALNRSTVVSYQDFLNASMTKDEEEDWGRDACENTADSATEDEVTESAPPAATCDPPIMLTPPDSRSSQDRSSGDLSDQLTTPPSKHPTGRDEEEKTAQADDEDQSQPPSRKVITVKALVHSPFHRPDLPNDQTKLSSPSASPTIDYSKKYLSSPRGLTSNVSVPDSSQDLSIICLESVEETSKKVGPVYGIFQKKTPAIKKEPIKEETQKEMEMDTVDTLPVKKSEKDGKDLKESLEKEAGNKQESSVTEGGDQQDVGNMIENCMEGPQDKAKKDHHSAKNRKIVASSVKTQKQEMKTVKGNSRKTKDQKETAKEDLPKPTRRVLRTRVMKPSSEDSSIDEFEDPKPPIPKQIKTQKDGKVNKVTKSDDKAEVEGRKKKTDSTKAVTPKKKFKSSLMVGGQGHGSIKLKLTAVKASPKKNTKVAKAQQLLQKAKKGHNKVSIATKAQTRTRTTRILSGKMTQATFGQARKVSEKGKLQEERGRKGAVKGGKKGQGEASRGDGAKKPAVENRRRSGSKAKARTPPKAAAKLAPIFTKQGQLAASKKFKQDSIMAAMATLDDSSRDSLLDAKEGPGLRLGLGGGDSAGPTFGYNMLEQLRVESTGLNKDRTSYMPITTVSHTLQKDENSYWQLDAPDFEKWKFCVPGVCMPKALNNFKYGSLSHSQMLSPESSNFKVFASHQSLTELDQSAVLDDILKAFPRFPAKKVLKMYQAKRDGESKMSQVNSESSSTNEQALQAPVSSSDALEPERKGRLSRGKRKAEESMEEDGSQRKLARRSGRGSSRRSLIVDSVSEGGEGGVPEGEGEGVVRRSTRRSSRRLSYKEGAMEEETPKAPAEQKEEEKYDSIEEDQATQRRAGMLWTEKYQPMLASELIGNASLVKKFHSWLADWKKKAQRMKEKTRNGGRKSKERKKTKGSRIGGCDDEDDSDDDFRYSDGDDSEEEDGLCNTVLLSGPHGFGKTSLVYACAQELGFEVFEVNASSRRSGRQILTELGEVTQSHQVARQPGIFKPSPSKPAVNNNASPKKKKAPVPKAFAAFFKKVGGATSGKGGKSPKRSPVKKTSAKRSPKKQLKKSPVKKAGAQKPLAAPPAASKPKVMATSLILFDEVDVAFEEDKGFLSAVTSFMESTKRPIVLTTSDPRFANMLAGRYDELSFKRPPVNSLTNHLQLICLAEKVYTAHQDVKRVVQLFDCDVRRCLLALQFWALSGAAPLNSTSLEAASSLSSVENGSVDCSAITSDKALTGKMVSVGVTSNADECMEGHLAGAVEEEEEGNPERSIMEELIQELIGVELRIIAVGEYYSMKGYKPQDVEKTLREMGLGSNGDRTSARPGTDGERTKLGLGTYASRTNLGPRLSEEKSRMVVAGSGEGTTGDGARCRKGERTLRFGGLFESVLGLGNVAGYSGDAIHIVQDFDRFKETSRKAAILGAFHNLGIDVTHGNLPHLLPLAPCITSVTKSKDAQSTSDNTHSDKDCKLGQDQFKLSERLGSQLMQALAEHMEHMSELDTLLSYGQKEGPWRSRYGNQDWWQPLSFPGLDEREDSLGDDYELVDVRPYHPQSEFVVRDINRWVEVESLGKCRRRCRTVIGEACATLGNRDVDDVLQVVLPSCVETFPRLQPARCDGIIRETHSLVVNRLPYHVYCNHPALALDYLPTLRGICRSEELRREANLKRRFHHYLDGSGLCLRATTYLSLASILNPNKGPV